MHAACAPAAQQQHASCVTSTAGSIALSDQVGEPGLGQNKECMDPFLLRVLRTCSCRSAPNQGLPTSTKAVITVTLEPMEHDEALVFEEVQCEGLTAGSHLSWSPTTNLLALSTAGEEGDAICMLDPSCPQVRCLILSGSSSSLGTAMRERCT